MIVAHTQRAASLGAQMSALTAALIGVVISAYAANLGAGGDADTVMRRLMTAVPFGLLVGALAGAIIFATIGFFVGLLGIKRVGWTFTYTVFGAILALIAVQPFVVHLSAIAMPALADIAGSATIMALAAITGGISGFLVAVGLKAGPTA